MLVKRTKKKCLSNSRMIRHFSLTFNRPNRNNYLLFNSSTRGSSRPPCSVTLSPLLTPNSNKDRKWSEQIVPSLFSNRIPIEFRVNFLSLPLGSPMVVSLSIRRSRCELETKRSVERESHADVLLDRGHLTWKHTSQLRESESRHCCTFSGENGPKNQSKTAFGEPTIISFRYRPIFYGSLSYFFVSMAFCFCVNFSLKKVPL